MLNFGNVQPSGGVSYWQLNTNLPANITPTTGIQAELPSNTENLIVFNEDFTGAPVGAFARVGNHYTIINGIVEDTGSGLKSTVFGASNPNTGNFAALNIDEGQSGTAIAQDGAGTKSAGFTFNQNRIKVGAKNLNNGNSYELQASFNNGLTMRALNNNNLVLGLKVDKSNITAESVAGKLFAISDTGHIQTNQALPYDGSKLNKTYYLPIYDQNGNYLGSIEVFT